MASEDFDFESNETELWLNGKWVGSQSVYGLNLELKSTSETEEQRQLYGRIHWSVISGPWKLGFEEIEYVRGHLDLKKNIVHLVGFQRSKRFKPENPPKFPQEPCQNEGCNCPNYQCTTIDASVHVGNVCNGCGHNGREHGREETSHHVVATDEYRLDLFPKEVDLDGGCRVQGVSKGTDGSWNNFLTLVFFFFIFFLLFFLLFYFLVILILLYFFDFIFLKGKKKSKSLFFFSFFFFKVFFIHRNTVTKVPNQPKDKNEKI